jgi:hypothetical protein
MDARTKTKKRSMATRVTPRRVTPRRVTASRVANWGVLMVALGQTACDEDPSAWDILGDAGGDASVVVEAGVDATSSQGSVSDTTGIPTGNVSAPLASGGDEAAEAGAPDASTSDAELPDASATEGASSRGPISETIATSSDDVLTATSTVNQGTGDAGSSGVETSAPTGGETSSEGPVDATDAGVPDAAIPALEVCGAVIDDSQGISLAQALESYSAPVAEADAGDGGAPTDCYPPCIAALMNSCSVKDSACALAGDGSSACWTNGVSQTQVYDYSDPYAMIVTESAYNRSAPCVSGVMRLDYESFVSTYVWRDGTGAEVATGTDVSDELVVTCTETDQSYTVDKYSCPWLGQIVFSQTECTYPNAFVK